MTLQNAFLPIVFFPMSAFLDIIVIPNGHQNDISVFTQPPLKVRLTSFPEKGKANNALVKILSKKLSIPRAHIHIKYGRTSRHKLVEFLGIDQEELENRLRNL